MTIFKDNCKWENSSFRIFFPKSFVEKGHFHVRNHKLFHFKKLECLYLVLYLVLTKYTIRHLFQMKTLKDERNAFNRINKTQFDLTWKYISPQLALEMPYPVAKKFPYPGGSGVF